MPKGQSLHVGVNSVDPAKYAGWSGPLEACEADARSMQHIAIHQEYRSTLMLTKEATRSKVVAAIEQMAEALEGGDIFFLSFAGHGGQIPDASGDENDLKDETWCLYDGQLIDDELAELWTRFRAGVRILVFSDSCHSGSVTRFADRNEVEIDSFGRIIQAASRKQNNEKVVYRAMPKKFARATYTANKEEYDEIISKLPDEFSEPAARVRLFSGCQDEQLSADGTFNGLFTGWLLRVWDHGKFHGNYDDFHAAICSNMPNHQQPDHFVFGGVNEFFDSQRPFAI